MQTKCDEVRFAPAQLALAAVGRWLSSSARAGFLLGRGSGARPERAPSGAQNNGQASDGGKNARWSPRPRRRPSQMDAGRFTRKPCALRLDRNDKQNNACGSRVLRSKWGPQGESPRPVQSLLAPTRRGLSSHEV